MAETREFIITYGVYYDCPTCDSTAYAPEEIQMDRVKDLEGIQKFTETHFGTYYFYSLYEIKEYGEIEKVTDFSNLNYGHRCQDVIFEFEGKQYKYGIMPGETGYVWWTEAAKILYGKNPGS